MTAHAAELRYPGRLTQTRFAELLLWIEAARPGDRLVVPVRESAEKTRKAIYRACEYHLRTKAGGSARIGVALGKTTVTVIKKEPREGAVE